MVEPRLPWSRGLIESERFCTHDFYREPRLINGKLIKEWIFRYSDGTFEILKMVVPAK